MHTFRKPVRGRKTWFRCKKKWLKSIGRWQLEEQGMSLIYEVTTRALGQAGRSLGENRGHWTDNCTEVLLWAIDGIKRLACTSVYTCVSVWPLRKPLMVSMETSCREYWGNLVIYQNWNWRMVIATYHESKDVVADGFGSENKKWSRVVTCLNSSSRFWLVTG